jgi:hypothetical protein
MEYNNADCLYLKDPSGKGRHVPYRQYVLNENQQFAVIALDFEDLGGVVEIKDHPGIESQHIGKLSEQNFIFSQQIKNSLLIDDWDFEQYPDPEVLLLTKI